MTNFNFNQVPNVNIEAGKIGSICIKRQGAKFALYENELPWMFYTPSTKRASTEVFSSYDLAYGNVLITGFGFGMLANWLANKPEVTSITVLEKSKEVIDLYLRNNKLPKNKPFIILYEDANVYKDIKHYDCILLDHLDHEQDMIETARNIGDRISHDVMWFWPLEKLYVESSYGIDYLHNYFIYPNKYPEYNLGDRWEKFRESTKIPTLPKLSEDKIKYYVNVYANNINKK